MGEGMEIRLSRIATEGILTIGTERDMDLPAFFRRLGKARGENCQVRLEGSVEGLAEAVELAACALYDGAYRFCREALKGLEPEKVWECRDALSDYGDTVYTLVSDMFASEGGAAGDPPESISACFRAALERGCLLGRCKGYARTLGNLPGNYLRAQELALYAQRLAGQTGAVCSLLEEEALRKMGCGGILAVNQGSSRSAVMAVLKWEGGGDMPWTALVGKGLMFDSGGYHLKSIDGMEGMKFDMCGAAGVLEAFEVLVRRRAKLNLMAVLLLAENMIGPDAVRMGDVIRMLAGKTVEVYNTDAEGRLVLGDGISYAQRQGAATVLDLATLTYSAQAALGDWVTAVFTNRDELMARWNESAKRTGEKFWRLPLDPCYHRLLEWSVCADFANYAPKKGAGASVAACFLENFVEKNTAWLHLDMVGPSVVRQETAELAEGASGACISTIVSFLEWGMREPLASARDEAGLNVTT